MRNSAIGLFLVLIACRYSPSDSGDKTDINTEKPQGSVLRGTLRIPDREDSVHSDFSGAKVEILGTQLWTTTMVGGTFYIDSVPAGNYTIAASISGYDTLFVENILVLPPNGGIVSLGYLMPHPTTNIRLDSIVITPSNVWIQPTISNEVTSPIVLFFGSTRAVGPAWDEYNLDTYTAFSTTLQPFPASGFMLAGGFLISPQFANGKDGFRRGDSVYVVAYSPTLQAFGIAIPIWRIARTYLGLWCLNERYFQLISALSRTVVGPVGADMYPPAAMSRP